MVDNSDRRRFWNCLKSKDDHMKETSTLPISEESWLSHFRSLPLKPQVAQVRNMSICEHRHYCLTFQISQKKKTSDNLQAKNIPKMASSKLAS